MSDRQLRQWRGVRRVVSATTGLFVLKTWSVDSLRGERRFCSVLFGRRKKEGILIPVGHLHFTAYLPRLQLGTAAGGENNREKLSRFPAWTQVVKFLRESVCL